MNDLLMKRIDLENKDDKKVSSSVKETEVVEETTQHRWIMCTSSSSASSSSASGESTSTIGYDCHSRPYMTVFLIISILVFIILRKSTLIKNWVASRQEKLQAQADEEEGLMQRVF